MCRGSLAWLGRQTHNLESHKGASALYPEVAGSKLEKSENPAPGTTIFWAFVILGDAFVYVSRFCLLRFLVECLVEHKIYIDEHVVVQYDERWKQ